MNWPGRSVGISEGARGISRYLFLDHFSPLLLKFMFSKEVTKMDEIFIVDLTVTRYCQIDGEDFVNFCGLL